jgi:hypothetical protein
MENIMKTEQSKKSFYNVRLILGRRFPKWTQHFWTWLTGLPLPEQKPLFIWRPWMRALALFAQTILAASLGTLLFNDLITRGGLWV